MSQEFKLPKLAEGVDTADVADLKVSEGDTIEAGQMVMELETDKSVMELACPLAGKITKILVKKGDSLKIGQPLLLIDAVAAGVNGTNGQDAPAKAEKVAVAEPAEKAAAAAKTAAVATAPAPAVSPKPEDSLPIPAGPATRRMARELGIDLRRITGTGPGGRILGEDVAKAYAGNGANGSSSSTGAGITIPPLPDFSQYGPTERKAFTKLQKTAANQLSLSWQVIPHVTNHDLADITDIEAARKRFVDNAGKDAPKVTMTAITMKAIVACLQQFPQFNASYDAAKAEVVYKQYYNLGIAVDTPTGLVVPVVRDVDKKSVVQLAHEMNSIAEKARAGKLSVEEMRGGTFTITNLGGIGGTSFTPIVNYPEVAILGMSRSQKQLQMINGELKERLMLPFSLSYDHRVINGADAARFLVRLATMFTDPFRLLVEC